ncbi:MAG: hypothetical protein V1685_03455 [Parcubacteria group bacterium]
MPLIISKKGSKAVRVDPSTFPQENSLQEYILNNPESVPLYEIRDDIRLLILVREFETTSGPIDALGIDNAGDIYLIETKLYKNPDKRLVVAQVLDYGAALWRNIREYSQFVSQVNDCLIKNNQPRLPERIQEFFGLTDEGREQLLDQVQQNFQDGSFKFVVLMDTLHEQLKNLILYLNQNSEFDVYAVELKYYKHEAYEIVIPHLYGSEVKKDLTQREKQPLPSDDDFLNAYATIQKDAKAKEFLVLCNDIKEGRFAVRGISASKTTRSCIITIQHDNGKTTFSLYLDPLYEGGVIQVWSYTKPAWMKTKEILLQAVPGIPTQDDIGEKPYSKLAKWSLDHFSADALKAVIEKLVG